MKRSHSYDNELDAPSKAEIERLRAPTGPVVLITGGSGGLGSEIAKLVYSHWPGVSEVRLLDQVPPQQSLITGITGYADGNGSPRVSYYPGDILKMDDLRLCFARTTVVIHCAAVVEDGRIWTRNKRMKRVNVEGTRNVIEACLDCGVQALVYASTTNVVHTNQSKHIRFDENYQPPQNGELIFAQYGGSKRAAEMLVLEANERTGKDSTTLHTCSLRLPGMYGESDRHWIVERLRMAKSCCGFFFRFWGKDTIVQSVYTGNAAWAHIKAAQALVSEEAQDKVGGNSYFIGDDSPAEHMDEYFVQFAKRLGYRQVPLFRMPIFLLMLFAFVVDFLAILMSWINVEMKMHLSRASVKFMKNSYSLSWDRARKDLHYEPLYDRSASIARSVEYYRHKL